jgi:choline dehydrogenase
VLPYFIRLEEDTDFGHEPWHGDGGPIPSTRYLDLDHTEVAAACSADPTDPPIIELPHLSDPADAERLSRGIPASSGSGQPA